MPLWPTKYWHTNKEAAKKAGWTNTETPMMLDSKRFHWTNSVHVLSFTRLTTNLQHPDKTSHTRCVFASFVSHKKSVIIRQWHKDLRSGPRGRRPLTRQTCPVPPGWWRSEAGLQEAEHLLGRPRWTCWRVERIFAAFPYSCQPPPCLKSHTHSSGHYKLTMEDDKSERPLWFSQPAVQSIQICAIFLTWSLVHQVCTDHVRIHCCPRPQHISILGQTPLLHQALLTTSHEPWTETCCHAGWPAGERKSDYWPRGMKRVSMKIDKRDGVSSEDKWQSPRTMNVLHF